jgi:succinate dehydrogenase/fumarate reductase cytochrome b subunit
MTWVLVFHYCFGFNSFRIDTVQIKAIVLKGVNQK